MTAVPRDRESGDPDVPRLPDNRRAAPSRLLGEYLREMRQARGYALKDVAPVIRGSISKISRLERGESPPKRLDVRDLARHYGATPSEIREFDELLRQINDEEWYHQYSDVTPTFLRRLIGLEGLATRISTFENCVVPGILQTEEYARELIRTSFPDAGCEEIDRRTELRLMRKLMLERQHPRVCALLDEGVLRRPVGGQKAMCRQLRYLRKAARMPSVNIRIIEFEKSAAAPLSHPITHLEFADGGPAQLVYVEQLESATYLTRTPDVDKYRKALDFSRVAALTREESERKIQRAIDWYQD